MADPLSLTTYVVQRTFKSGLNASLTLSFTDEDGNPVLKSQGRALVTQQTLETMDGKVLATITHQNIAATPEYDIRRTGPKDAIIGVVKVPLQLVGGFATLKAIEIKDASGNIVATASGNFLDMEFDIVDSDGNPVAKVTRKMAGGSSGVLGRLAALAMGAYTNPYVLQVTGKGVDTQTLLEFLVALELLLMKGQGSSPGIMSGGFGMGNQGFGGGGLGGGFNMGGGSIQL